MTHPLPTRFAAATLFALFTLVAAPRARAQNKTDSTAAPKAACTATLSPATPIQVAPTPVILQASVTGALGDSLAASLPAESKVAVVAVKAAASPNAIELTLNTSSAVPGEWPLSIKGSGGECTGTLKIEQAKH